MFIDRADPLLLSALVTLNEDWSRKTFEQVVAHMRDIHPRLSRADVKRRDRAPAEAYAGEYARASSPARGVKHVRFTGDPGHGRERARANTPYREHGAGRVLQEGVASLAAQMEEEDRMEAALEQMASLQHRLDARRQQRGVTVNAARLAEVATTTGGDGGAAATTGASGGGGTDLQQLATKFDCLLTRLENNEKKTTEPRPPRQRHSPNYASYQNKPGQPDLHVSGPGECPAGASQPRARTHNSCPSDACSLGTTRCATILQWHVLWVQAVWAHAS